MDVYRKALGAGPRRHRARSPSRPARRTAASSRADGTVAARRDRLRRAEEHLEGRARGVRPRRRGAARRLDAAARALRPLPRQRLRRDPPRDRLPEHGLRPPALPGRLKREIYALARRRTRPTRGSRRDASEQFIYKTRKKAIGPFKENVWNLPGGDDERHLRDARGEVRIPLRAPPRRQHEGHGGEVRQAGLGLHRRRRRRRRAHGVRQRRSGGGLGRVANRSPLTPTLSPLRGAREFPGRDLPYFFPLPPGEEVCERPASPQIPSPPLAWERARVRGRGISRGII